MEEIKETPNEFDEFKEFENTNNTQNVAIGEPIKINPVAKIDSLTTETSFSKTLDAGKVGTLSNAIENDKKFNEDWTKKIKDAAQKAAELEVEKQKLEKQNIEYHQQLLETQQKLNEYKQNEDKWYNKQRKREFAYNGLKPILKSIKADEPLFIPLMYLLTLLVLPFYLLGKLFRASIGNILTGINDKDKKTEVKGLYWTILGFLALVFIFFTIVLILNIFGAVNWLW